MARSLKDRLKPDGRLAPGILWGKCVKLLATVRGRPVVQSPPPADGRWQAPAAARRVAEPSSRDLRRMNRLGRRAKLSGLDSLPSTEGSRRVTASSGGRTRVPDEPHPVPGATQDNVP